MNIRLSEKHGVNPSIEQCFYCLQDVGVFLFGKIKVTPRAHERPGEHGDRDPEAPRYVCRGPAYPCDKCQGFMEQGIILISVCEKRTPIDERDNPYRTGGWVVLKEEAVRRILIDEALAEATIKARMAFVPDEVWDALGLPRGDANPPS